MSPDTNPIPVETPSTLPVPTFSIAKMAVWDFGGRLVNYLVIFVVSVIMTRLLSPVEFGAFAIVLAIISFSSIFVDLGFRSAIVQAKETTAEQLSTVFYINMLIGIVLIGIFSVGAGYIESFYEIAGLRNYVIASSFLFGLNAAALIPGGLLQKDLQLKALSIISTVAAAVSGSIAIYMAVSGFKIWALVVQQLINAGVTLVGVLFVSRWLPSFIFKPSSIKSLWQYGARMFVSGLSDTIFVRADVFIIGKMFPIQTLGFYNRAQSLDSIVKTFSASTTSSVAFPVIARMADDAERVREFYKRCLNVISFLSFLLIGVLFLGCFDIVIILFTEKWVEVGYYFRIMAVTAFIYPVSALMVNLIAARGNSAAFLKLELIKKTVLFPVYLSFFIGGVYLFLILLGLALIAAVAINAVFVEKEISVSIKEQMSAIFKYAIIAVLGVAVVFAAVFYISNTYMHLLVSAASYSAFYLFACYILKMPGFLEIYDRALSFYNDKRYANISTAA